MKVKELITKLLEFDMDLEVGICRYGAEDYYSELDTLEIEDVRFPCEDEQKAVICS